jgi:hypothetical protein
MEILGYKIIINKIGGGEYMPPLLFPARRKLARAVDSLIEYRHGAGERGWTPNDKIVRIKAVRELTGNKCGLYNAKEWVERAFGDNGRGTVR